MLKYIYKLIPTVNRSTRNKRIIPIISGVTFFLYQFYCKIFFRKRFNYENNNIIVTLASYPPRINTIYFCIQSLIRQDYPVSRIILNLSNDEFPSKELPILKKLRKLGIEINFVNQNLKSYNKFYYIANSNPKSIIITADDDVLYPEDWVRGLINTYNQYPNSVVCYRAHLMRFGENGELLNYSDWLHHSSGIKGPSRFLVAVGVGGVLYPPNFFSNISTEKKIFLKLAPTADDLWLKAFGLKNGYDVVKVNEFSKIWFDTKNSQKTALKNINTKESKMNDIALNNLFKDYNLSVYFKNCCSKR